MGKGARRVKAVVRVASWATEQLLRVQLTGNEGPVRKSVSHKPSASPCPSGDPQMSFLQSTSWPCPEGAQICSGESPFNHSLATEVPLQVSNIGAVRVFFKI